MNTVVSVPLTVSGPVSVILIVMLGIFVYPWLLRRRRGAVVVIATLLLAALFVGFQASHGGSSWLDYLLAAVLGAAPALAGIIVTRLQGSSPP
ncbi:MAG: hypothetical protein ACM32F_01220 [Betaproteobacteria bacterium]